MSTRSRSVALFQVTGCATAPAGVDAGGVFSNCHLILCRNVLIYLDRAVGERVVAFLANSLAKETVF